MAQDKENQSKPKNLQFKVSSALKNIIGSDLINSDFIAIFELVKNSYDAHATKVSITFENINGKAPKIFIKDNGKGMNYNDLLNKWLFVAYSAKQEGTEEDNYDYRNKIHSKRAYAGSKGIGRFSCDRLGSYLYLETTKDETNALTEVLMTNWSKFESNLKDEFVNINVTHETLKNNGITKHGTTLEISNLKSDWNRIKLLKLKDALAKLINPNTHNEKNTFQITLNVEDEKITDNKYREYKDVVNGKIQNLIFETLDLKTTKITSNISSKNKIETSLYEGGKLVYRIIEQNTYQFLHDIDLVLYYMNRSAKLTFARKMGVDKVTYGHVFVYKNGLRIYPYGERGEDPLKMDVRKGQGHSRYLGTREIIGYVSINESNDKLRETSSRGDGLIQTDAYHNLVDWFYTSLKRVEKYIIDIVDWGNDLSNEDYIQLDSDERKLALEKLITNLTRSKNILHFEVAPEIFSILDEKTQKSAKKSLLKISKIIQKDNFNKDKVLEEIKSTEKKIAKLQEIKEESEKEALEKSIENKKLSSDLEEEKTKGAFQGALIGTDKERIIGLQHQVGHSSSRIHQNIKLLLNHLGSPIDKKTEKYIRIISLEALKINSISKFITKANFKLTGTKITEDIIDFISEYINEVYLFDTALIDTGLNFDLCNKENIKFITKFKPLEITTIIDNFISNAEKSFATNMSFSFKLLDKKLEISIIDNGSGIAEENYNKVFSLGYTTTDGSGIGLYQIYNLITEGMKGKVDVSSVLGKTTTFRIII